MTRFGVIGEIVFRVSFPQMRFAVSHLLPLIRLSSGVAFAFSIPPLWVVASDDYRCCHCRNRLYGFIPQMRLAVFEFAVAHSVWGERSHLLSNPPLPR